jgi:hypothetical protein
MEVVIIINSLLPLAAGGDSCKQPVEASHDALAEQDESKLKNRKL